MDNQREAAWASIQSQTYFAKLLREVEVLRSAGYLGCDWAQLRLAVSRPRWSGQLEIISDLFRNLLTEQK